jgi:predicted SPOUT superfamily RNA methylase MTH1
MSKEELKDKFDMFLNTTPERGTRSIRTEENMLVSLAALYPKLRAVGNH